MHVEELAPHQLRDVLPGYVLLVKGIGVLDNAIFDFHKRRTILLGMNAKGESHLAFDIRVWYQNFAQYERSIDETRQAFNPNVGVPR